MSGWTDLGYSARSLARTPWLSLTLLLTIALGIGSNTAVAGFVRGLVARTGPIPGTDRLVSIFAADTAGGFGPVSYDDYRSIASHHELLESIGIARQARSIVVLDGRQSVFSVASISRELSGLVQLPPSADFVVSHRLAHNPLDDRTDLHDVSLRIDDVEARVTGTSGCRCQTRRHRSIQRARCSGPLAGCGLVSRRRLCRPCSTRCAAARR